MWESKTVANLTRTRFQDASEVEQRLGTVLEPVRAIFKHFLKSPHDKMISKTDRSDEMKIFKNTCVFTVRLYFRKVDNARTELAITFFFAISH